MLDNREILTVSTKGPNGKAISPAIAAEREQEELAIRIATLREEELEVHAARVLRRARRFRRPILTPFFPSLYLRQLAALAAARVN